MNTRILIVVTMIYAVTDPVHAAFILDDFDDPAEVVSPEMEGELVLTQNVGDLNASRRMSIFDLFSAPRARMRVQSSLWEISREPQAVTDDLGPGHFTTSYIRPSTEVDFTQAGANDAVFVTIRSISGPSPPAILYTLVFDHSDSFEFFYIGLVSSASPTTIALPFDAFRGRGGGSDTTDFNLVSRLTIDFIGNGTANGNLELGWIVEVDRISVGRIPEPRTLWAMATLTLVAGRIVPAGDR